MLKKLRSLEYSSLYPLFFTIVFILILIQYPFKGLDTIFYDLWVRFDVTPTKSLPIVVVTLDEDSDQFLGEYPPYTYASHARFIKRLTNDKPLAIGYMLTLMPSESPIEQNYQLQFKELVQQYLSDKGKFRFATEIVEGIGEILPPDPLKPLGFSPGFLNYYGDFFSEDMAVRQAMLNVSGEDSLHLWASNVYREKMQLQRSDASSFLGQFYKEQADARFALFKYNFSPQVYGDVERIPFHRVLVGNFPEGFFKDKIVLVGSEYISNQGDYAKTPWNKDAYASSKMLIHANIISSLANKSTIYPVNEGVSKTFALIVAVILSFVISRVQPTRGLLITISIMLGAFLITYVAFIGFGWWIKLSHIILSIFVVYYIWVPFRAIEEYQTRYAIQEEAKLLKQVDNLKQNFISLMSHDLKTPVAKIAGIADILRIQYDNKPEQNELLGNIVQATKELNNFITSILDLTKIESQNLTLRKESKDINKMIEGTVEKLAFEAERQAIEIITELAPLYPIQVDLVLINRVISNLVENAIKYAGKGSQVAVKTWDDAEWVYIEIRDNGIGIGKDDLAHIFDKFYRVKNDSSHSIKGSGLGLYLVKYFIELHSGTISAESEIGKGTAFTIKLKNE